MMNRSTTLTRSEKNRLADRAKRDAAQPAASGMKLTSLYEITFHTVEQELVSYTVQAAARSVRQKYLFCVTHPGGSTALRVMPHGQALTTLDNHIAQVTAHANRTQSEIRLQIEALQQQILTCQNAGQHNRCRLLQDRLHQQELALNRSGSEHHSCVVALQNEYIRLCGKLLSDQKLLLEKALARICFYQTEVLRYRPDMADSTLSGAELLARCSRRPDLETAELLEAMKNRRDSLLRRQTQVPAGTAVVKEE